MLNRLHIAVATSKLSINETIPLQGHCFVNAYDFHYSIPLENLPLYSSTV